MKTHKRTFYHKQKQKSWLEKNAAICSYRGNDLSEAGLGYMSLLRSDGQTLDRWTQKSHCSDFLSGNILFTLLNEIIFLLDGLNVSFTACFTMRQQFGKMLFCSHASSLNQ